MRCHAIRWLLLSVALLASEWRLLANFGETPAQVSTRYGRPIQEQASHRNTHIRYCIYQVGDRKINVEFMDGKECGEVIHASASKPSFPDKQCIAMATAISGKTNWQVALSSADGASWVSADAAIATLTREPGKPDTLLIETTAAFGRTMGAEGATVLAYFNQMAKAGTSGTQAQAVSQLLTNFFEGTNPFSANAEFILENKTPWSGKVKVLSQAGNVRIEMDLREMHSADLPQSGVNAAAQNGLSRLVSLFRSGDGSASLLYPDRRSYVTNANLISVLKNPGLGPGVGAIQQVQSGDETVAGRPCKKVELTAGSPSSVLATIWRSNDPQRFPVRISMPGVLDVHFKDVKFGPLDSKLFEVPRDYVAYGSTAELASGVSAGK